MFVIKTCVYLIYCRLVKNILQIRVLNQIKTGISDLIARVIIHLYRVYVQAKTVYRIRMAQNNLKAFVFIATVKSILNTIDSDTVIDRFYPEKKNAKHYINY